MKTYHWFRFLALASAATVAHHPSARGQSVSPLIAEYTDKAEGYFEVSNTSAVASVVVIESKSFSIKPDGMAEFRDLDPGLHVELSTQSMRLEPHQSGRVFYKVSADHTPAWLCIYSGFSAAARRPGLAVKVMLPHTVYLYQHHSLPKEAISVGRVWFDQPSRTVRAELTNDSGMAGRAQSIEISGQHVAETAGGFPMLPHSSRVLTLEWTDNEPPQRVEVQFEDFALKLPVAGPGN